MVSTKIKRAANMGYNAILIKDATSGFTDSNYSAMLDILPLYAKLIAAAEVHAGSALTRHRAERAASDARNIVLRECRLASAKPHRLVDLPHTRRVENNWLRAVSRPSPKDCPNCG